MSPAIHRVENEQYGRGVYANVVSRFDFRVKPFVSHAYQSSLKIGKLKATYPRDLWMIVSLIYPEFQKSGRKLRYNELFGQQIWPYMLHSSLQDE